MIMNQRFHAAPNKRFIMHPRCAAILNLMVPVGFLFALTGCSDPGNLATRSSVVPPQTSKAESKFGIIVFSIAIPDGTRKVAGLMDVVDSIDVAVSHASLKSPLTTLISKSQITDGLAVAKFSPVPVGTASVTAEVKDSTGYVVASGSTQVTVLASRLATASLNLAIPTTGSIGASLTLTEEAP